MQLVGADGIPRCTQQEAGLKPFVERNVTALEHRADRGAKLFAAAATEFQSSARTFSGNRTDQIVCSESCPSRSIWPENFCELAIRGVLIPKIGPQNEGHVGASLQPSA